LPRFQGGEAVYLSTLVVSPDKQGLGLGKKLFNSIAEHWFPGTTEVDLVARKINHRAIRLYYQMGFVAAPDIDSPLVGDPRFCFFMRLKKNCGFLTKMSH
jgi:ribosomal protein S18 acetylase RimI-like enzyme